jgi:hypothetical protein
MAFRIVALPAERFAPLFSKSDDELAALGARRMIVDDKPGFPCRVSLVDAEVGETVLLVSFLHHDVATPYRGSSPVFIRAGARTATPGPGEVPLMLRHRLLSVRAYDQAGMLLDARVAPGTELEAVIGDLFAPAQASYLHLHNAGPGCFNCAVLRA